MNPTRPAARPPFTATTLRVAVAAAALALGAGLAVTASAHPGEGPGRQGQPGMHAMHAGMGGHGMHGAGLGGRALDAVGATDEQKAQVRQIMDAARKDLQGQHEAGRALREQMRTLLAQPSVDANAVEALRQQMQAHREQASRRMTQAMVEASRVLTPEQRQAMAEHAKQREERMQQMQRQRGERGERGQPGEHRHEHRMPGAGRT
ncbi:MAG: Spy/CpxP family protein refolding chaperone [Rubrivivax sp.]|nr:Spy/CpxP family protein refolding chaperone [Rubrivivax sp.]